MSSRKRVGRGLASGATITSASSEWPWEARCVPKGRATAMRDNRLTQRARHHSRVLTDASAMGCDSVPSDKSLGYYRAPCGRHSSCGTHLTTLAGADSGPQPCDNRRPLRPVYGTIDNSPAIYRGVRRPRIARCVPKGRATAMRDNRLTQHARHHSRVLTDACAMGCDSVPSDKSLGYYRAPYGRHSSVRAPT